MTQPSQSTALLVMDMQFGILPPDCDPAFIAKVAAAIAQARAQSIPVIYVVLGFRPGAPELSTTNSAFASAKQRMGNADMNALVKIEPLLTPQAGEIIVTKKRFSAFTGSDLEVVLRTLGIQHLVLTGFATRGVVLSTLREAADKDYRLTVLADCCADREAEVHDFLMTRIFPANAEVIPLAEWRN